MEDISLPCVAKATPGGPGYGEWRVCASSSSCIFLLSHTQLSSVPLRLRNVQVAVALGNLYKNFKNDR